MWSVFGCFILINLIWQFTTGKLALIAFAITLVLVIAKRDNEELSDMIRYAGTGLIVLIVFTSGFGLSSPITWLILIITLLCTSFAVIAYREEVAKNKLNEEIEKLSIEQEQRRRIREYETQQEEARRLAEEQARQQEEARRFAEEQAKLQEEAIRLAEEQANQERMRIAAAISRADYDAQQAVRTNNLAESLSSVCDLDQDYMQDLDEERGASILEKHQAEKTLPMRPINVASQVDSRFAPYRPYDNKPQAVERVSSYSRDLKHFVKVKFPNSDKTYDYLCSEITVGIGDVVVVPNKGGTKRATVVDSFFEYMEDMPLPKKRYKKVIGLADYDDEYDEDDWDGYCVDVKFNSYSRGYSYRCPFSDVDEGDFVRVRARGKITTAQVVRTFYDDDATWSMVLAKATDHQIDKVSAKFEEDDYDDELSWEEEEGIRRDYEEDERRRALEEEEELREIYAEEARRRQIAAILAYQAARERSYSSSRYYDDWSHSDNRDDNRIYDSRGNMVNGKLLEYYRNVEKTGIADTEYEQELKDGYTYCDDHDDYDDCRNA